MSSPTRSPHAAGQIGPDNDPQSVVLQQALERLRQERDIFDLKKAQDAQWHRLQMGMGWTALVLIPAIMVICMVLLLDSHVDSTIKALAADALLVDIVGLMVAIWKIMLGPTSRPPLAPVTSPIPVQPRLENRETQQLPTPNTGNAVGFDLPESP